MKITRVSILISVLVLSFTVFAFGADRFANPVEGREQEKLEIKEKEDAETVQEEPQEITEELQLPEDDSAVFDVSEIMIQGNTWVETEEIFRLLPDIYNASDMPADKAPAEALYDFKNIKKLIETGEPQRISAREIQGLTSYILSVYQRNHFAGIYVYVPATNFVDNELRDGILNIKVIEAPVSNVEADFYDPNSTLKEKSYLKRSYLMDWSPVEPNESLNRKALDDYLNILNLNPDRYTTAYISSGFDPNSILVTYNVYEADPQHWYIQLDNSGTEDRQWTPRLGMINTNLLGIDDTFSALFQAPWDSECFEEYAVYGSYDFPIYGPRVRLELSASYNEYDITGGGAIDFLGRGHSEQARLRVNLFQVNKWLFDVTTSVIHEESRVSPSDFSSFLTSDIEIDMWGAGVELYKRNYLTDIILSYRQLNSFDGSDQEEFSLARPLADRDFTIHTTSALINKYLDADQIHNFRGLFRWITSDERLVPSRLTTFGGMYTVRGYDEYEIITDGGILASVQYEYDIVAKDLSLQDEMEEEPFITKLSPLVFFDYGLAKTEDPVAALGETEDRELASVGCGLKLEIDDSLTGTVYYGYPLIATDDTNQGKGRVNAGFLYRF